MSNRNSSDVLDITSFIGKGRSLNLEGFSEVKQVRAQIEKANQSDFEKSEKTDIEKGELGDALSYNFSSNNKFKKKGSEIKEKVQSLVGKVEAKKVNALSDMNKIVEDTGITPSQRLDEWDRRGISDEIASTLKRYSWEQCSFNSNNQTANCIVDTKTEGSEVIKCASTQDEADKCRLYNSILYSFQECCRDLDRASVFLRNVDEKKQYELTLDEMKALGF